MSKGKRASRTVLLSAALMLAAVLAFAAEKEKEPPAKPAEDTKTEKEEGGIDYVEVVVPDDPDGIVVKRKHTVPKEAIDGYVLLSDGKRIEGGIHLTPGKVLKFYDPDEKEVLRFRLDEMTHIEQKPVVERVEKEWRWLENANDQKVYTGHTYPWRKLATTLHLKNGKTLTGDMTALLFVVNPNGPQRIILHKRQKGKLDTKLEDLIYVKLVDFRPQEKDADAEKKKADEPPPEKPAAEKKNTSPEK